jgi:hypothetical protein
MQKIWFPGEQQVTIAPDTVPIRLTLILEVISFIPIATKW